jgi:hypothetical protein
MKESMIEDGLRVKYVSGRHGDSASNPLWGGEHGYVGGTLKKARYGVSVYWDNKRRNSYSASDLELLDFPEGNFESIWRD